MKNTIERIRSIYNKYRELILYVVFGIGTTVVNMVIYDIAYRRLGVSNVVSTIIAWLAAVTFAFFTNKLYVFGSRQTALPVMLRELAYFFSCRALTGVLDVAIMYFAVDRMHLNALLWKVISNVIVTVINYVASKLFIFKGTNRQP